MKKNRNKTWMIIALVSILLCACPGCLLLIPGFNNLMIVLEQSQSSQSFLGILTDSFLQGGWMICLGAGLVLIPFVLVIITVVKRNDSGVLEKLEPTGASKDEPLPPPS